MLLRYYSRFDGQPMVAHIRGRSVRIGSGENNDIVLKSPFVDPQALELVLVDKNWKIRSLGMNGVEIQGKRLLSGEDIAWDTREPITLFPFVFQLQPLDEAREAVRRNASEDVHQLVRLVHLDLVHQLHMSGASDSVPKTHEELLQVERSIESSAAHHGVTSLAKQAIAIELSGSCIRDAILGWLLDRQVSRMDSALVQQAGWSNMATEVPSREEELNRWKLSIAPRLFKTSSGDDIASRIEHVDKKFWDVWQRDCAKMSKSLCEYLAMRQIKKQVKDTLFGFGPLEDLLRLPMITEIMVNASDEIFIEKGGVLQNSGRRFVSDEVTQTVIERIVGRIGRRIDTAQPMVDARLPDGSRVNAVIPPLAVKGPCLTIRKFSRESFTLEKLVEFGSLTNQVREFLNGCVRSQRSILVSGGTGTGKTTLLNCLSQSIPYRERIICIEDTHELQLDHPHVVFVECRDGNNEGKGKVVIRDLLKNALRQRPDRLIVGECRGDEALDMLQAMNTGHDGSMTTIHANTPADALRRLEVLVRESGLPSDAVRQQIVSAIDIVVQLTRQPDGRRVVTHVDEVVALDETTNKIRLRPIFRSVWDETSKQETLAPTGCIPTFACELIRDKQLELELFLHGIRKTPDEMTMERDATDSELQEAY